MTGAAQLLTVVGRYRWDGGWRLSGCGVVAGGPAFDGRRNRGGRA